MIVQRPFFMKAGGLMQNKGHTTTDMVARLERDVLRIARGISSLRRNE